MKRTSVLATILLASATLFLFPSASADNHCPPIGGPVCAETDGGGMPGCPKMGSAFTRSVSVGVIGSNMGGEANAWVHCSNGIIYYQEQGAQVHAGAAGVSASVDVYRNNFGCTTAYEVDAGRLGPFGDDLGCVIP